jgi:hypothetical protein
MKSSLFVGKSPGNLTFIQAHVHRPLKPAPRAAKPVAARVCRRWAVARGTPRGGDWGCQSEPEQNSDMRISKMNLQKKNRDWT